MIRLQIRNGLDIDLGSVGAEEVRIEPAEVALLGADYPGVRPHLAVEAGDRVRRGDVLFTDRARPEIRFTAPAGGRVSAVHRGARRALESLVLTLDPEAGAGPPAGVNPRTDADPAALRQALLEAGLWPAFRSRPYELIPDPGAPVREIYVTALDTNPLAADPAPRIREHPEAFRRGLEVLAGLGARCYVCMAEGAALPCPEVPGLLPVEVAGPHPAGLPGTHIYAVAEREGRRPPEDGIWHLGWQDVIAMGRLFLTGAAGQERLVSVGGPGAVPPRLVSTVAGARLTDLTGEVAPGIRVVSGSPLSGRTPTRTTSYLGRYHQQVVLLPASAPERVHGTGLLALQAFEGVWPHRAPVLPLLRALLMEDTETVSALGCTLLAEEDLALCSYVCPSRLDYGAALVRTLAEIRRGA